MPNEKKHRCKLLTSKNDGTRGVLLADDMGLGKTVESLAGAWLHRCILRANGTDVSTLPIVIVAPNHAVLEQWKRHIIRAGPELSGEHEEFILSYAGGVHVRQRRFRECKEETRWILMTRHTLQSEIKHVFNGVAPLGRKKKKKKKKKGDDDDEEEDDESEEGEEKAGGVGGAKGNGKGKGKRGGRKGKAVAAAGEATSSPLFPSVTSSTSK
jgi:hypothetical protein